MFKKLYVLTDFPVLGVNLLRGEKYYDRGHGLIRPQRYNIFFDIDKQVIKEGLMKNRNFANL
jgi:hypothetical protein